MPLTKEEISELTTMVAVARKRDVGFGLCLGKKPETTVMEMHRMKAPDILERQARKAGETAKSTSGMATVTGKVLTLKCLEPPPAGLVKPLKGFFKFIEMPMKICIADAEGNLLEEDDEEDAEAEAETGDTQAASDEGQTAPTGTPPPDADRDRWTAVRGEVARRVAAALPGTSEPDKITKLWAFAQARAASGDFANALAALKPLMPLLVAPAAAPAAGSDPMEAALAAILDRIREHLGARPDQRSAILALVATVRDKSADPAARSTALAALKAALEPAAPKVDVMAVWRDARETADLGIAALQGKLAASPLPDLRRIAEFGLNGVTAGNQTAMMGALMTFNAASGPSRQAAAKALLASVGAYRSFLSESAAIRLCEDNPFGVACTIRAPLLQALDAIDAAAKAA
jgi:hypothetical protein